jgi:hypothetical protein
MLVQHIQRAVISIKSRVVKGENMFMKKLTVAAALTLFAAGAYASNFRGADQVYIPIAGHTPASTGTFITDVYLSNLSNEPVTVSVIYQPIGENLPAGGAVGTEFPNVIQLRAGERKQYLDFFRSALNVQGNAFGQLIFNACRAERDCGPTTQNEEGYSEFFRPISVESRTYQVTPQRPLETTGQLFSGTPWYHFTSQLQSSVGLDKVFITGITYTGEPGEAQTYRTNIGAVNASQYSTTKIVFRLYRETLTDFVQERIIQLAPLGSTLLGLGQMFPNVPKGSNYFVTVEQRDSVPFGTVPAGCQQNFGCPAFIAFGSVLDNLSGDATTLEPQYMLELSPDAIDEIYPRNAGKPTIRRSTRH